MSKEVHVAFPFGQLCVNDFLNIMSSDVINSINNFDIIWIDLVRIEHSVPSWPKHTVNSVPLSYKFGCRNRLTSNMQNTAFNNPFTPADCF